MQLVQPDMQRSFAGIPGTIARYFGSRTDTLTLPTDISLPSQAEFPLVCLIFIDAFGWRFLQHFTEVEPIAELVRLTTDGEAYKISSQFPSTTAAHVTTIHTGLPVWESGVCEWYYYESQVDRVITPLPFCSPANPRSNSLTSDGIRPEQVVPEGWFYPELRKCGVTPYQLLHTAYETSAYNSVVGTGSEIVTFTDHANGLIKLKQVLSTAHQPAYVFYYFEEFDSCMHRTGPLSAESAAVLKNFFVELERSVLRPLQESDRRVLFVFTADHGMTHMNPATTRYLDVELPQALSWLRTTAAGSPILPTGSARDLFLHIRPAVLQEAYTTLKATFIDSAEVFLVQDMLQAGYFGTGQPSEKFLKNIGDILIAPYAGESVFWLGEQKQFRQTFYGHHGGLTADEMESIFLVYPLRSR